MSDPESDQEPIAMPHKDKMTILETERLVLRRLLSDDIPSLINLWTDPEVTLHMGGPRQRQQLESGFAKEAAEPFAEQYDLWPLVEKRTGRVVGHCGLLEKEVDGNAEIELVYVIARASWGNDCASEVARGLISYAFGELKLPRLLALIEPENAVSEAVAKKVGMHVEKETVRPGGGIRKVYCVEAPET
jgi:ribosomal-protein-alanine N-acetyltransferase